PERLEGCAAVQIENLEDCPRYTARVVRGVKVGSSPRWLQEILKAVGVRPINNVVDITNYVLMELGHPLHAFDFDRLEGGMIVVRSSKEGEAFTTLDGKERRLRSDTLMICDAKQPVAIAGVMGGANTEISESTENVLIESAYFNPRSIRRTSKYLSLSTDASQRFERGADPNATRYAVDRAAQLMQAVCGGRILKGVIDVYPRKIQPRLVPLRVNKVNEILGTDLREREIVRFLSSLEVPLAGRGASKVGKKLKFRVPTFRPDLEREIDLIEEIARVYGYDNIETRMGSALKFPSQAVPRDYSDEVRDFLVSEGYQEIVTNSLQKKWIASLGCEKFVEVMNPISEDMAALRTSLVPGALEVIHYNINHGTKDIRIFEIGHVFRKGSKLEMGKFFEDYVEEERIIIAQTGLANAPGWERADRVADFFDLKGTTERLLRKIFLDKFQFICYPTTNALTEFSVGIEINGSYVGFLGKMKSDIAMGFGIDQEAYVSEISIEGIGDIQERKPAFQPLPKYPSVVRDLAFVVDEQVAVGDLEATIQYSGGDLLKKIRLFDLYVGDQIELGKNSCAFSLEFLSRDRTLTEEEI
ncbi:MAG: phenylalanine--tRNA ligase subunit beta, partial [Bacteroidota bacterium]